MKIRLASIEGKIADPLYNEEKLEDEILNSIHDGIDLLVFPANSIKSNSIDSLEYNELYQKQYREASSRFERVVEKNKDDIVVVMSDNYIRVIKGYIFDFINNAQVETIEHLSDPLKNINIDNTDFKIICMGNGTESVSQKIYSNLKMICFRGKILACRKFGNQLDYEFDINQLSSKTPYLDKIEDTNVMFCDILNMQTTGLYNKMKSMNRFKICMGISGGLDSTVALAVCVEAFKKYNLPLENIIGVTMPGLGTTERTYNNALTLMKEFGITIRDIDLRPLLKTHLKNIDQPKDKFDVTYEQCQSRERTQVLLDIANRDNAIMIGTGCMSEFALGWMTYGGDHLCMYAVNIGLPKTVVKMYAQWLIDRYSGTTLGATIKDVLEGPVSPELLPIDDKGEQHEKTESLIGDYMVQDFFIYHMTVNNVSITKLFKMACNTFTEYTPEQILKWLDIFTLRYFTRAYKKNCYGDGIQIFNYSVSPWYYHIPSDIDNSIWKKEIEDLKKEFGV